MWQIGSGSAALSPDGKHLAVSDQTGQIVIWDIDSCKIVKVIDISKDKSFTQIKYSLDGKQIVGYSTSPNTYIEVIDLVEERVVWSKKYAQSIDNLRMARDGIHFFWNGSSRLIQSSLLDTTTQILFPTLRILSFDCSPTEDIVACRAFNLVLKNDTLTKEGLVILNYINNGVKILSLEDPLFRSSYSMRFLKTGNSVVVIGQVSDTSKGIQLVDIHSGKTTMLVSAANIIDYDFFLSNNDKVLSYSSPSHLIIWDISAKEQLNASEFFNTYPTVVGFSNDSKYLFVRSGSSIKRLLVSTLNVDTAYNGIPAFGSNFLYSPSGKTISTISYDNNHSSPTVWDSQNGNELFSYHVNINSCSRIIYSQDSAYLFGISQNVIYRWSLADGHAVDSIISPLDFPYPVSPNIHYCVYRKYITSELYDLLLSRKTTTLIDDGQFYDICFSHDSRYLACSLKDTLVKLFVSETGEFIRSLPIKMVLNIQFSPDGTTLLSRDKAYSKPILYNIITGVSTINFDPMISDSIRSLTFSADGKYIAGSCTNNTIRVWDVLSGKIIAQWDYPMKNADVTFSPDLHYQVVAKNGIIYFQETPFEMLAVGEGRNSTSTLSITPNPTSSDMTITYCSATDQPISIQILDILGNIILEKQIASPSLTHKERISLGNRSGMFYAKVTSGREILIQKFVKQ